MTTSVFTYYKLLAILILILIYLTHLSQCSAKVECILDSCSSSRKQLAGFQDKQSMNFQVLPENAFRS